MNLDKWHQLREKTAELSLRERGILTGTLIVLVIFIWLQTAFTDYEKKHSSFASQKNNLMQDKVDQSMRLSELTALLANDPNAALRLEQEEINASLQNLRREIEDRMSNLIAPEEMADLLKNVLSDYKGLDLLSARNLPVEPLNLKLTSKHAAEKDALDVSPEPPRSDENQAVIFTHGFEMKLAGRYFQTIEFLQKLEGMNGFYWRMLSYKVDAYPKAEITIQLSTLSLEEDWIGV